MAIGPQSHAEGFGTTASGNRSHAEGYSEVKPSDETLSLNVDSQKEAIIEGWNNAENKFSLAAGAASHVEGSNNLALGWCAHTEGEMTLAYANGSHALLRKSNKKNGFTRPWHCLSNWTRFNWFTYGTSLKSIRCGCYRLRYYP